MRGLVALRSAVLAALRAWTKSRQCFFALWVVGTAAILAAVALSGDLGLLALIADRELLVLIVETAAVYGLYAWRTGALAVAWGMVKRRIWMWAASCHLQSARWGPLIRPGRAGLRRSCRWGWSR